MLHDIFIQLVRLGLGHIADTLPSEIPWSELQALANKQGLSAVVLDGIDVLRRSYKSPDERSHGDLNLPAQEMILEWIGEVMQGYEYRYEQYQKAISELAGFYNSHGLKMMVLKGYACSLTWPKPKHRPCGDIDIWLFGQQKEADECLEKEKNIKIDKSRHHHTVFYWRDFMVENHYDFINVHHHKSNRKLEEILKELGKDDTHHVELYGERVYLPSPNLHALFLLRHAMSHFAASEITLRQIIDWAFWAEANHSAIDWNWLEGVIEQYGMKQLYDLFNGICVDDLGFDPRIFPNVQFNPFQKDRVLCEIIAPKYSNDLPNNIILRIVYKYKRWRENRWKQALCYKESRSSAFISGLWAHLLKPKTI